MGDIPRSYLTIDRDIEERKGMYPNSSLCERMQVFWILRGYLALSVCHGSGRRAVRVPDALPNSAAQGLS